jgi:putative sterol carrier protein
MADATAEFFDGLARRGHEAMLEKTSGTMRVELVNGKRTERWLVAVDQGDISVSHKNVAADFTLRADKAVFNRIAAGEMNATAAVLRGELALEGDWELMVRFQRLLPGPPTSRKRRRATGSSGRKRR